MSTITLSKEDLEGVSGEVVPGIQFAQILESVFPGMKTASHDDAALEKTIRTLKLAAEPGELYPVVADRIAREAEIYRDFLQNPRPIGKISLTVKELDPDSSEFTKPREQYQVHDPSEGKKDHGEGCASVGYKFNRSSTKVLEFIVHDAEGAPLFAIARTYSDWLGSKEFKLGPNRIFYLNMVEDSPGYVMVYAGFETGAVRENVPIKPKALKPERRFLTPVVNPPNRASRGSWAPFGNRLAYLIGFQCTVVSIICCTLFWVVTGRAMASVASLEPQVSIASQPITLGAQSQSQTGQNIKTRLAQRAKRLARVKVFRISVDNDSCKSTQGRCVEWLSTVQKGVESSLSGLSVPTYPHEQPVGGTEPAKLVISYESTGREGQIHLTLYDREGALWHDESKLNYSEVIEPSAVNTYCEEASSEIIWEIIAAKLQLSSGNELKEADQTSEPVSDPATRKEVTKKTT